MTGGPRLDGDFYAADPASVARRLLGQRLVVVQPDGGRLAGLIVETEAYLGVEDKAAHTFGWRKTERNASMFEPGGTAYVFLNYGIHSLLEPLDGGRRGADGDSRSRDRADGGPADDVRAAGEGEAGA